MQLSAVPELRQGEVAADGMHDGAASHSVKLAAHNGVANGIAAAVKLSECTKPQAYLPKLQNLNTRRGLGEQTTSYNEATNAKRTMQCRRSTGRFEFGLKQHS